MDDPSDSDQPSGFVEDDANESTTEGPFAREPSYIVASRLTVIQTTFAVLISSLLVGNILLVWAFGYMVIYFEQRGRLLIRRFHSIGYSSRLVKRSNA